MADEDNIQEENGQLESDVPEYEELAQELPEREVTLETLEIPKEGAGLDETDVPAKTDFQSALMAIMPKFASKRYEDVFQPILVSRVLPDNYIDLNYFIVMNLVEELEDSGNLDFLQIVTFAQAVTSKALEGKHIIDVSELFGAANDQEMEKLSKEMLGS